jgi:excinuclease ABC subunit C
LIVDGGRAQWNAAQKVLKKLGLDIPVLGITKGEVRDGDEHFIMPDGTIDNSVPKDSKLFLLLRTVRDEAHRFAITFHKKTRSRNSVSSELDEIEGIGSSRRKTLLRHFGSVSGIAGADIDAISRVPGISKSAASKIYLHFHPDLVK